MPPQLLPTSALILIIPNPTQLPLGRLPATKTRHPSPTAQWIAPEGQEKSHNSPERLGCGLLLLWIWRWGGEVIEKEQASSRTSGLVTSSPSPRSRWLHANPQAAGSPPADYPARLPQLHETLCNILSSTPTPPFKMPS